MNIIIKKILFICILLVSVFLLGSCSGQKVQTVKEEAEANKILDVLREQGINAHKVEAGEGEKLSYEVYVYGDEEEYGAAIQLMDDHCLPQPIPKAVETSGLVSSIEVEKAQELRRRKISIETQLRRVYGTTCVDITIVPPEKNSLSLNPYKASATALVKYKTEKYQLSVDQIARVVAGGVPALTADNVTVILSRQPLRELPDLNRGRNIRRIIYVSVIGFATILIFVGILVFLRKKKRSNQTPENVGELEEGDEENQIDDGYTDEEPSLIEEGIDETVDETED